MKNIDNNICQMSTPLSVRKALLMIYFIYIVYISFQNDKKSCDSGFQVVEMQVLDYFTNSVYTLGLSEDCP